MIALNPRERGPIPDREWDEPATVAALGERDARALLRLARKYGASQHFLSARAMYLTNQSLTQNQLSLIANGKQQVEKLQVWERLAAALDMPDRARILLGLAPLAPDQTIAPPGNGQPGDLEGLRRSLTEALEAGTLSESGLDDWEQTILAYGRATRYTVPGRLLHGLLSDFGDLETQLKARQPARLQRRLARVAAQFTGMVSLALTNLGQYDSARRWGRTARVAAGEAGDPHTLAWVRAQDAYALFYEGGNYHAAAEVARHAQELSGATPSVGAALAAALEARAHGLTGQHAATLAAIGRAEDILAHLDTDSVSASALGYNEAQLRFHEGNALTHLGKTAEAWKAQQRALKLYPATDTLDRTLVHLDRAICLARSGDMETGTAHAVSELAKLAPTQRTDLIIARTAHLLTIVEHRRTLPPVRELHAILAEPHPTP